MQIVEELHAARMGKSVDLGELTSMEIDLVEDDMHSSAGTLCMHLTTPRSPWAYLFWGGMGRMSALVTVRRDLGKN